MEATEGGVCGGELSGRHVRIVRSWQGVPEMATMKVRTKCAAGFLLVVSLLLRPRLCAREEVSAVSNGPFLRLHQDQESHKDRSICRDSHGGSLSIKWSIRPFTQSQTGIGSYLAFRLAGITVANSSNFGTMALPKRPTSTETEYLTTLGMAETVIRGQKCIYSFLLIRRLSANRYQRPPKQHGNGDSTISHQT